MVECDQRQAVHSHPRLMAASILEKTLDNQYIADLGLYNMLMELLVERQLCSRCTDS